MANPLPQYVLDSNSIEAIQRILNLLMDRLNAIDGRRTTTGNGASATFAAGSGTGVNNDSTFDGYTLVQVVKALRNVGVLE